MVCSGVRRDTAGSTPNASQPGKTAFALPQDPYREMNSMDMTPGRVILYAVTTRMMANNTSRTKSADRVRSGLPFIS